MVNVIAVLVLATMVPALKPLATIGAAKRTANGAMAATVFEPPLEVFKKPAVGEGGIVLV